MQTDQTLSHQALASLPVYRFLPRLYRLFARITKKRGLRTLWKIHEPVFGGEKCVLLPGGAKLYLPDDPHYFGFFLGLHEGHVTGTIERTVRDGDVCIDIGANIGYFSVIMARAAGASGTVFAFEPVPETFKALQANAVLAGSDGLHIVPQRAAISANEGELVIEHQAHSTLNQVRAIESDSDALGSRVQCMTLSDFLSRNHVTAPVAMLKIDVEGHEVSVMKGALPVLKSGQVRQMIIEVTPGDDAVQMHQMLSDCGAKTLVWEEGAWQDVPLQKLRYRTDVLALFPAPDKGLLLRPRLS